MTNPVVEEVSRQETTRLSSVDGWNTLLRSLNIRREQTPRDVLTTLRGLEEIRVDGFEKELVGHVTRSPRLTTQGKCDEEVVIQEGRPREWKAMLMVLEGLWQDAGRPGFPEDLRRFKKDPD